MTQDSPIGRIKNGSLYWTDEKGIEHSGPFIEGLALIPLNPRKARRLTDRAQIITAIAVWTLAVFFIGLRLGLLL